MPDRRKPLFCRPVNLGTIAAGNEAAGRPARHLNRHKAAGLVWRTAGSSNVWARGQMAGAQVIDFAALLATNAQAGSLVRLRLGNSQAEVDGAAPYDSGPLPIIPVAAPNGEGAPHSFLELPSLVSATWWRIDATGHSGDFEAGALVLGKKVEPSRFYDNTGHTFGAEDLGKSALTRWGVLDEEPGKVLPTVDFTLSWQTEAEYEANWRPLMREVGVREPLYCCFDPAETDYRNGRTFLGPLRKAAPAVGVRKPKTYAMEFSLISLF